MKLFATLLTLLTLIASVAIGIYAMGERFSLSGLFFLVFMSLPLLFALWVLSKARLEKNVRLTGWVLVLLSLATFALLYDAFIRHPDAQSGLVFFVIPVYQFPVVMLASVFVFLSERKAKKGA